MQKWFQYVHVFRLDAKIINYAPGVRFFVKETISGQNGLSMSLKNATLGEVFLHFGSVLFCFLKKALHREPCPTSALKFLFKQQLQHLKWTVGNNSLRKLHGRSPYLFTVNLKTVYSSRKKRCFSPSCFISKLRGKNRSLWVCKSSVKNKISTFLYFYTDEYWFREVKDISHLSWPCSSANPIRISFCYSIKQLQCQIRGGRAEDNSYFVHHIQF